MLQAPLPAWLVAWDFSAAAVVLSVDGAAALNLSTPGMPLQFALASLPGAGALAPGAAANASLHGSVPGNPGAGPGARPLVSRVSVNGVACPGPGSTSAPAGATAAAAPAVAAACGAAWGPAAGAVAGPGGPSISPSAWRGASPAPGAGESCMLSFCCPDVPTLATSALSPAGEPSAGSPAGPGPGPELPPAGMPTPSAPAPQPVAGAAPTSSALPGILAAPAGAPAPLQPPLVAGALAAGQAQGPRVGPAGLVVGVAAAGAAALALSAACVAALVLRARRSVHSQSDQQPPRSWPTTSAPVQGLGPALAVPAAPAGWGNGAARKLDQAAAQVPTAAAAAPHVLKPQQLPPFATGPQSASAGPGPGAKAGAGAAQAPALWQSVAAPPVIRVPVSARAGWLPRPYPNSNLRPDPSPNPRKLWPTGLSTADTLGAPRAPPHTPLGMLTDLRALTVESLSRRSTWPLAALAASPAPQSPDSPWRPGSAPWPSAQVLHFDACARRLIISVALITIGCRCLSCCILDSREHFLSANGLTRNGWSKLFC